MLREALNAMLRKAIHIPRTDVARVASFFRSDTRKCCCTQNIHLNVPKAATQATKSVPWVCIQTGTQSFHQVTKIISLTKVWSGSSEPSESLLN